SNWFFTPPIHTWTISDPVNVIALIVFIGVATLVSALVTIAARRSIEAAHSRAEAAALVRLAGAIMAEQDPLPTIMHQLRSTFSLQSVALLREVTLDEWTVIESSGENVPTSPAAATDTVNIDRDEVLAVVGPN